MGRYKKNKSEEEVLKYKERRREQNRNNTRNHRLRKKLLKKIQDVPLFERDKQYEEELKIFLKKQEFNFFITLTTEEEKTLRNLKTLSNRFLTKIKLDIGFERVFYVIEKKGRPHIHFLLKTDKPITTLINSIKKNWFEGYVRDVQKIYSGKDEYKLEHYLVKEVFYNSPEVNWEIV